MSGKEVCSLKGIVAAQQGRDAVFKDLAKINLIGQRKCLANISGDRMSTIDDLHGMFHVVPIAGVQYWVAPQGRGRIKEASTDNFPVLGPQWPPSEGMVKKYHAFTGFE